VDCCGALLARLTITADEVTWDQFAWQDPREEPYDASFEGVGPIVFDRHRYRAAIRSALPLLSGGTAPT
jgi:hypothetical protein